MQFPVALYGVASYNLDLDRAPETKLEERTRKPACMPRPSVDITMVFNIHSNISYCWIC